MPNFSADSFARFIGEERMRYAGNDNNRVAFSLGQISRYVRFLEIPKSRYHAVSTEVVASFRRQMAAIAGRSGIRELTAAEVADLDTGWRQQVALHFEIESFFLFAKILLDKVAHFIEDFFGAVRGLSLRSHDRLYKLFTEYANSRGLTVPMGMLDTMIGLCTSVAGYRDKQIAHLRSPRAAHGTHISGAGSTEMGISALYPTERDSSTISPNVDEVAGLMEAYLEQLVGLIQKNRDKGRYKLLANEAV